MQDILYGVFLCRYFPNIREFNAEGHWHDYRTAFMEGTVDFFTMIGEAHD